ncbi:MAG: Ig-like domain-containing protein [Actinomycetota bacterium]|nr:Ig-like domain-containing protein [Actinomycetota bacterium]
MLGSVTRAVRRPLAALAGGALMASAMVGLGGTPAGAQAPVPHWGNYEWAGGQETANVRAFWLFDRTGDPTMNYLIDWVADAWNGARAQNPELPYIAVYQDNANAGKCFVNRTPGYNVASACMMPSLRTFGINGIAATHGSPHFLGGAFAISDGLSVEDAFTAVCHNFGHIMGLADSEDEESCMNHDVTPGEIKWYGTGDAAAILDLYGHDDGPPPVAVADTYTTDEDVALTVAAPGVLDNDTDADDDPLTAVKVTDPANGTLALAADGSFTYTPEANFNGTDTFTYKATGDGSESAAVTVTITVTPVADVPVAVADTYQTDEDTPLTEAAPGVLGNDTDPDGDMTAVKVTDPANGTVVLAADGSFTYTPEADFSGTDSFTYKAGGAGDAEAVKVTITVNGVNDAPVAVDDAYATTAPLPLTRSAAEGVLANDTDVEGDALTATDASDPAGGTVILNPDGSFTYTPDAGFTGVDTFTYKANDGSLSDVGTVKITVSPAAA